MYRPYLHLNDSIDINRYQYITKWITNRIHIILFVNNFGYFRLILYGVAIPAIPAIPQNNARCSSV